MKTTFLLLAGICTGWLLHAFWQAESVTDVLPETAENRGSQTDLQLSLPGSDFPTVATTESDPTAEQSVGFSLQQGSVQDTIAECRRDLNAAEKCRQHLLDLIATDITNGQKIELLEAWLTESPADLQAGLLLIDTLMQDRRYRLVTQRLRDIKNYQVESVAIEQIAEKVKAVIRTTERLWHENNELDGLIALYRILLDSEPQNPRWHFALSGVLKAAGDFDGALSTLSYILYDAEFGERATSLYLDINNRIRTRNQPDVPLIKNGSHFIVEAVINKSTPLRLLIDTGASITSIDKNILQQIRNSTTATSSGTLQTVNGTVSTTLVQLDSLSVGEFSINGVEAASIESLDSDFDGLLGMDFLSEFTFSIDQEKRLLLLAAKPGR